MFLSEEHRDIPGVDVLSWVFGNTNYDLDQPVSAQLEQLGVTNFVYQLLVDAQDDTNTLSHNEAKVLVRKLIAGFRAEGLRPGDSVCLHSYNSVSTILSEPT